MKANKNGFCAANFAGIVDPVRLQGYRAKARAAARQRAIQRLMDLHRAEYEAIRTEEFEAMDREFLQRLQAAKDALIRERLEAARKAARERGAA